MKKCGINITDKIKKAIKIKRKKAEYEHIILANNYTLLKAMKKELAKAGYKPIILTNTLFGEAREVAKVMLSIAEFQKKGIALLAGGETTVTVKGRGRGGRNQEMCLSALKHIKKGITFTAFASDGKDGVSNNAGAIVDYKAKKRATRMGINLDHYLSNNDSETVLNMLKCSFRLKKNNNLLDVVCVVKH